MFLYFSPKWITYRFHASFLLCSLPLIVQVFPHQTAYHDVNTYTSVLFFPILFLKTLSQLAQYIFSFFSYSLTFFMLTLIIAIII